MSNALAIATVTAGLREILTTSVDGAVNGARATAVRPDGPGTGLPDPGVNVYLYQVAPNAARRNEDLPTRSSEGSLSQRPRAAIDLHYLLTFYGDDGDLVPQRMLGAVLRDLHARPILTAGEISVGVVPYGTALQGQDLSSEQIDRIRFNHVPLTLEELSKLWSVFFQTTYRLSVALEAGVVLLETDGVYSAGLPVRTRNVYAVPLSLRIDAVVASGGAPGDPIFALSSIDILGSGLGDVTTTVWVDGDHVPAPPPTETKVTVTLPALPAGIHSVVVKRDLTMGTPSVLHRGLESNPVPFVLTPRITAAAASNVTMSGGKASADITVDFTPHLGDGQRISLILNELGGGTASYAFVPASQPPASIASLTIPVAGVDPGDYLVRLRIDNVLTPLDFTAGSYATPKVTL